MIFLYEILFASFVLLLFAGKGVGEYTHQKIHYRLLEISITFIAISIIFDYSILVNSQYANWIVALILILQVITIYTGYKLGILYSNRINKYIDKYCRVKNTSDGYSGKEIIQKVNWDEVFGGD